MATPTSACARKSSTPASAAIAAAVSGLSPVIITVRIPIARKSRNRSAIPPLTMSLSSTTPRTRVPSATTRGVEPALATVSPPFSTISSSAATTTPVIALSSAVACQVIVSISQPAKSGATASPTLAPSAWIDSAYPRFLGRWPER